MTDPVTPTDAPDEALEDPDEVEGEDIETGAWMGEKDDEPSTSPEPEWD